ncbi:MAG: LysR family transcriptional regulator [Azoarcus sp.]|jgi:DNA-binding transcriptional LysR family regulator|nr:LysR family transcriptional regulator [Azoarcus sp.]
MYQGIRHIRAFLSVARLGSFTKSALELHVSQPALTVQIRQLEEWLGVRLFDRNKRHVALTSAGQDLLPFLARVLTDLEMVMNVGRELAGIKRGTVTVAALPSVAANILPVAILRFREKHPGVNVRVSDVIAEQILHLVKQESIDFGISSKPDSDVELEVEDFWNDQLCVFFPDGHTVSKHSEPTLRDVAIWPLILTMPGTSIRTIVDRAIEKEGLDVNLSCEVNYVSTAISMVHAGLGVSILPASVIHTTYEGVHMMPIYTHGLTRKIGIIRKRNRSLSPAATHFIETLKVAAQTQTAYFKGLKTGE